MACQGERVYDNTVSSLLVLSGNVIVTTVVTDPSKGPGVVSMMDQLTGHVSSLAFFFESSNFAIGVAMLGAESIVAAVEGVDRLVRINLRSGQTIIFSGHAGLSSNVSRHAAIINTPRAIATDAAGAIYIGSSDTDTVEKLSWFGTGTASRALPGPLAGPIVYTQNPLAILVVP
jgi:hypothetical protein